MFLILALLSADSIFRIVLKSEFKERLHSDTAIDLSGCEVRSDGGELNIENMIIKIKRVYAF